MSMTRKNISRLAIFLCITFLSTLLSGNKAISAEPITITGQASFNLLPSYISTTSSYSAAGGDGNYTYSLQSNPEQVIIDSATGTITIAPGLALGSYSFKVVATDGTSATGNKDVTINVAWAPITITGQASFNLLPSYISTTSSYSAAGGDGNYTYSLQSNPEQVIIDSATGTITIAPGLALGSYSFKVVATDGTSATGNKDVTINVAWAPITITGQASFNLLPSYISTTSSYSAAGGDGNYTYSLQSNPEQVIIDSATGTITIAPGLALGSYSFKVVATDGTSATGNKDVTINVAWAPITITGQASFNLLPSYISTTSSYSAAGGDGNYTYSLQSNPEQVIIDSATGTITIAPGLALGSYSFKVVATDGTSATGNKDVTINVAWAPITITGQASFNLLPSYISTTSSYSAAGGDGNYTYSLQSNPEQVIIDSATGTITIAPGLALGSYSFKVVATDGTSATGNKDVTINVAWAPITITGQASFNLLPSYISTTSSYSAAGGDGNYTYSLQSNPEQVIIDSATGTITIAPGLALGSYSFKVVATDGTSATGNKDVTINVAWAPITITGQASFNLLPSYISTTSSYSAAGGDGNYTYSLQSNPEQVIIDSATGTITIAPGLALGSYSFKVVATDGTSATGNKDVTINVAWAPITITGQASFNLLPSYISTTSSYSAAGGDGNYTYSLQSNPEQVIIDSATGTITIAPGLALGSYNVGLIVADGSGNKGYLNIFLQVTGSSGGNPGAALRVIVSGGDYSVEVGEVVTLSPLIDSPNLLRRSPTCKIYDGTREIVSLERVGNFIVRCQGAVAGEGVEIRYVDGRVSVLPKRIPSLVSTLEFPAFYDVQGFVNESVAFLLPGVSGNSFKVTVSIPRKSVKVGTRISLVPAVTQKVSEEYPVFLFKALSQSGFELETLESSVSLNFKPLGETTAVYASHEGDLWLAVPRIEKTEFSVDKVESFLDVADGSLTIITELTGLYGLRKIPEKPILVLAESKSTWTTNEVVKVLNKLQQDSLEYQSLLPEQCSVSSTGNVEAIRAGLCVIQGFLPSDQENISAISNPLTIIFTEIQKAGAPNKNNNSSSNPVVSDNTKKVSTINVIRAPKGWIRLGTLPEVFVKKSLSATFKEIIITGSKVTQTKKLKVDLPTRFVLRGLSEGTILVATLINPNGASAEFSTIRVERSGKWTSPVIIVKRKGNFSLLLQASNGFNAKLVKVQVA